MNEKVKTTEISQEQQKKIDDIKILFSNIYDFIDNKCSTSREKSLTYTKLDEALFWATKGIIREKEESNG